MADLAAWVLAVCGLAVVGTGVFFVAFRLALMPEDRRYIAASDEALKAEQPGLGRWLQKVFCVMGGYMIATGILTIHSAQSDAREGLAVGVGDRRRRRCSVGWADGSG